MNMEQMGSAIIQPEEEMSLTLQYSQVTTVEPPNNGHVGDKHFVHCSEVVPSSEKCMDNIGRG